GDKEFTAQTIDLLPGDRVYLYTDGLTDQFDAENRKRLGSGQVKKLLTELSAQPLAQQEAGLAQALDHWRGETRQTDDMLLIGFGV
nr:serine/threonine-protein phosphatase [Bernardetiaceae bacterium]